MYYDPTEIAAVLTARHNLNEGQIKEITRPIVSITDTINFDLEHSMMRPFSHNVIGLALVWITQATSHEVALSIMDQVPAIEHIYKIQRPEDTESHGEPRTD